MAYKYVSLINNVYSNVTYNVGDLFHQIFEKTTSSYPLNDPKKWEPLLIPNINKSDIYIADMNYDGNGNNQLISDITLIQNRIIKEKNRLYEELSSGYESRANILAIKDYSQAERDSFSEKLLASQAWNTLDNITKDAEISSYEGNPFLYTKDYTIMFDELNFTGDAANKRLQVNDLASLIVIKNNSWRKLIGYLTRDRKTIQTEIDSVSNDEVGLDTLLNYTIVWSI